MIISFLVGILLGIIFFGGLYWSVRKLTTVKYPGLLMAVSVIGRMVILLAGIYLVAGSDFRRMIAVLLGVVAVKFFMIFKVQREPVLQNKKE